MIRSEFRTARCPHCGGELKLTYSVAYTGQSSEPTSIDLDRAECLYLCDLAADDLEQFNW